MGALRSFKLLLAVAVMAATPREYLPVGGRNAHERACMNNKAEKSVALTNAPRHYIVFRLGLLPENVRYISENVEDLWWTGIP